MALPVNGSTHLTPAYYLIYRPRKDERLSWLTYSGWLTHISGHPSAAGRAQDRESSPARDRRCTNCATPPTWTPGPPLNPALELINERGQSTMTVSACQQQQQRWQWWVLCGPVEQRVAKPSQRAPRRASRNTTACTQTRKHKLNL